MKNTKGYLYLIQSLKDGSYYFGSTKNLQRRIKEHKEGQSLSTKLKCPWQLLVAIQFDDVAEARRVEQSVKKRKEKLTLSQFLFFVSQYVDD